MRVFLTGTSGWIGSTIARDLLAAGHSVVGLVRSQKKGSALASVGGTPLIGSLGDLDVLRQGVRMRTASSILPSASISRGSMS